MQKEPDLTKWEENVDGEYEENLCLTIANHSGKKKGTIGERIWNKNNKIRMNTQKWFMVLKRLKHVI